MKVILVRQLLKTLTLPRLINAALATGSFIYSAILKNNKRRGQPFILTIEPTNLCNLKCPLCVTGNGKMTRPAGSMSFAAFKKIIDETQKQLIYLLLYQQGEPFLNKNFLRFVEYAKSKKIYVTTSSNGHYFNKETAWATVQSKLDSIIFSVDGADQRSYEAYRVGGSLRKVQQGLLNLAEAKRRLKSATPVIFMQFIVMRHNEHQIAAMKKIARKWGANRLLIKTVHVENAAEAEKWLPQNSKMHRYVLDAATLKPRRSAAGACPRPWTSALINWDGTVVPCCFDKNGQHVLGEIQNQTQFTDTWNSEKYANFRQKMLVDRSQLDICRNCSQGIRLYI